MDTFVNQPEKRTRIEMVVYPPPTHKRFSFHFIKFSYCFLCESTKYFICNWLLLDMFHIFSNKDVTMQIEFSSQISLRKNGKVQRSSPTIIDSMKKQAPKHGMMVAFAIDMDEYTMTLKRHINKCPLDAG